MGEKIDEAKGRVKEATGDLTDDDKLKNEGKLDRAGAEVKEKAGDAVDAVKDKAKAAGDKVRDATHRDRS
jgi:uncharacterized protein YjbJ (UPF0337 family)